MARPLVSVITPTWNRHELLLNRCIPSVQAQAYRNVEHVIVSDGPDPELANALMRKFESQAFAHRVEFAQLPQRSPDQHWGHEARLFGLQMAEGDLIAYIDDDDSLRPSHVPLLAALFENSTIEWAYSVMASHSRAGGWAEIGHQHVPSCGQIGTPMIMHRRSALEHGTWGPASSVEDWELVERWMKAGLPYSHLTEVTVDVWPSVYWHS